LIPLDIRFFPMLESFGLIPRNRIVWVRQHGLHARRKFSCRHETILWFTKSDKFKFSLDEIRVPQKYQNKKNYRGDKKGELSCNPDGKNPGDIWIFRNVKHNHEEQTIHPCQFPEDLIARIVLSCTDINDVVLDPYMGTGTVAVVCKEHTRNFLGAELEESYCTVAQRRLAGQPDQNGFFPNLKTLRRYASENAVPAVSYRFDVQVGRKATEGHQAKIFTEEHHKNELFKRLDYEEKYFGAKIRNDELPVDKSLNGKREKDSKNDDKNLTLFKKYG